MWTSTSATASPWSTRNSAPLPDRRGKVLANLGADKANRILANASGGDILKPFTFAWQGDTLVFVDAVNGVVGVYTEK